MKKVYSILAILFLSMLLIACEGNEKETEGQYDLNGLDFTIMVDSPNSADPRSSSYERLFKQEKIAKINEVEEKYNINVVYKPYPSNASWGGARERYIIEEAALKQQSTHVYEIISTSIGNLAQQGAIVPLDDYMELYGSDLFWESKKAFGQVQGQHYGYDDQYASSDKGLYYNVDLLKEVLGEDRMNEPLKLWQEGNWNWETFEALALELKAKLRHDRPEDQGGAQYVLGGRTYNHAYGFIGANGGQLVDTSYNTYLTSEPVIDTLNYLNRLYSITGMWIDDAQLSNTSQPEFAAGRVVFQDGEAWHVRASNKWGGAKFGINYVPFPVGPNVKEDMSNYTSLTVGGKSTHVISSSFSKADIAPGYEDLMIHDETIFKIWSELQYFPEDVTSIEDDFYNVRLLPSYKDEASRVIHIETMHLTYPDNFYSVAESNNHNDTSFMIMIQEAVRNGDVRGLMTSTEANLQAILTEKFKLDPKQYQK